jgi:hypothetical protein
MASVYESYLSRKTQLGHGSTTPTASGVTPVGGKTFTSYQSRKQQIQQQQVSKQKKVAEQPKIEIAKPPVVEEKPVKKGIFQTAKERVSADLGKIKEAITAPKKIETAKARVTEDIGKSKKAVEAGYQQIKNLDLKKVADSYKTGLKATPGMYLQGAGVLLGAWGKSAKKQEEKNLKIWSYISPTVASQIGEKKTATDLIEGVSRQAREKGFQIQKATGEEQAKYATQEMGLQMILENVAYNLPQVQASTGMAVLTGIITKNPLLATMVGVSTAYSLGASEVYNEARDYGLSDEQAVPLATLGGLAIGALDFLPMERLIRKTGAVEPIKKVIIKRIIDGIVSAGVQSGYEGVTEGLQEIIGGAVAKTYNENRDIFQGTTLAVIVGAILGGAGDVTIGAINLATDTSSKNISEALQTPAEKRTKQQQQLVDAVLNQRMTPDQAMTFLLDNKMEKSELGKTMIPLILQAKNEDKSIQLSPTDNETSLTVRLVEPNAPLEGVTKEVSEVVPGKKGLVETVMEGKEEEKAQEVKSTDELVDIIGKQEGGYRTEEQIAKLREDIKANGITYPVELVVNKAGEFEINDGVHRIRIAKDLGIKEIPFKVVKVEAKAPVAEAKVTTEKKYPLAPKSELREMTEAGLAPPKGTRLVMVYGVPIEEPLAKAVDIINTDIAEGERMHTASSGYNPALGGWSLTFNEGEFSPKMRASAEEAGLTIKDRHGLTDLLLKGVKPSQPELAKEAFDKFADHYQQTTAKKKVPELAKEEAPTPETEAERIMAKAERIRAIEKFVDSKRIKFKTLTTSLDPLLHLVPPGNKLTTRFLEHPDIKSREFAGYEFLSNLINSVTLPIKQSERDVVKEVLETHFKDQGRIDMKEFRRLVVGEMLPLDILKSTGYADYGMERLGLSRGTAIRRTATTYLFNSNFEHGKVGHFSEDFERTIPKADLEIKKITKELQAERGLPNPEDKYAVVRKGVALTEANVEDNVFQVAESKEKAQSWIDAHALPEEDFASFSGVTDKKRIPVIIAKKGLFGHFRDYLHKRLKTATVMEIQSDPFQAGVERLGISPEEETLRGIVENEQETIKDYRAEIIRTQRRLRQMKRLQEFTKTEEFKDDWWTPNGITADRIEILQRELKVPIPWVSRVNQYSRKSSYLEWIRDQVRWFKESIESRKSIILRSKGELALAQKKLEKFVKKETPKEEKLYKSYRNIWHERVAREIIALKAREGLKAVRFPTPRTVALIEGFIRRDAKDEPMPYTIVSGNEAGLEQGDIIDYGGVNHTVMFADNEQIRVAESGDIKHLVVEDEKNRIRDEHWTSLLLDFKRLEDAVGKVDTPQKAQKLLEAERTLLDLATYNMREKSLEQLKKRKETDSDIRWRKNDIARYEKTVADGERMRILVRRGVLEELTPEGLADEAVALTLAKKYKISAHHWTALGEFIASNKARTATGIKKAVNENINKVISQHQAQIEFLKERLASIEKDYDSQISSVESLKRPSPDKLKDLVTFKKFFFPTFKARDTGLMLNLVGKELNPATLFSGDVKFVVQQIGERKTATVDIESMKEGYLAWAWGSDTPDFHEFNYSYYSDDQKEVWVTDADTEVLYQPDQYKDSQTVAEFDLSKFEDEQRTVLNFYNDQLIPYLEKIRKDNLERVTDELGNEWIETKLTEADKEPPTAYRIKEDMAKAGLPITNKQEQEIINLNRSLFGDTDVKVMEQILTNRKALGSYQGRIIKILKKQADPKETYYHEAVHKYLDVFLSRSEHVELLREAQERYGIEEPAQVEERVAEDFIQYAKSREGFFGKIKLFFDRAIKRFQAYLKNLTLIDALYTDIVSGKGREEVEAERRAVAEITRPKAEPAVSGFNPTNLEEPHSERATKELEGVIKRSEIAKRLSEKLNVPIRRGKFRSGKAIGIYKPGQKVVRIKSGGLSTVFHEVGHFLDDVLTLSDDITIDERKALMTEYGYKYEGQAKKQKQEALAEYLRYWLTGQNEKIADYAPLFHKKFKKKMKGMPEIKEVLDVARADFKRWEEQPATAKILSQLSIGKQADIPMNEKIIHGLNDLYTQGLDDLHPLSAFVNLHKKLVGKLPAELDPYKLARNLRGWVGKADLFLNDGTFGKVFWKTDEHGKTVMNFNGKSYTAIMKPLEVAGLMDDFRVYIVSQRVVKDLAPRHIETGISTKDAKQAIETLEKAHPEFPKIAEERRAYKDRLLDFAYENGLIGEEALKKMKELNKFHVPFYRVMEEMTMQFLGKSKFAGNLPSPIKKIRGSEREIIDPIESDIKDTYAIINASERNNIGVAMANLAGSNYELGRLFEKVAKPMRPVTVNVEEVLQKALKGTELTPDDIPEGMGEMIVTLFRPMQDRGANMLNVNFGDKQEVFQVDPDLFKAIQGLNAEDVSTILRIMAIPAKLLRAGATLSPDFTVRNPIRDQFTAFVYSKYGFVPGIDLSKGIWELLNKGEDYKLWKAGGGEHSMFVSLDREDLQKNYRELMRSKGDLAISYVKNPIKTLRLISEFGEVGTRLGEAKKALAKGVSPIEASFASREVTLDFARIGAKGKAMNMITAFFNANVQASDKMVRSFKERPFQTLFKALLGITLPSVLLYFLNRDDPRWKEIPQWQKDLFWIILTPKHIVRIPKPFELGILFGSVPERILEIIDTQDPYAFRQLRDSIVGGFSPGIIPTGLIPILENITNHSFFLNRPIVSQTKEALPPAQQVNTYTSEVAKIVGQVLNYSPAKIDNLMFGYTAGLGRYAVSAMDTILKGTGIVNVPTAPAMNLEDSPVIKAFMVREPVGSQSESVNRIYDLYGVAEPQRTYVNRLVKEGRSEEAKEYAKGHPQIMTAKILGSAVDQFSDMNKAITAIRNSRTLSATEKRDKIRQIQALQTEVARKTLEYLRENVSTQ